MNPFFKAVRSLIWFIATGCIVVGGLMTALELLGHRATGVSASPLKVAGYALVFLIGAILLFTAGKIAAAVTDEDENDDDDTPIDPHDPGVTGG